MQDDKEGRRTTKRTVNETIPLQTHLTVRLCAENDLANLEWFGLHSDHRQIIREAFERQRLDENLMLIADLKGFPVAQVWIDLTRPERNRVALLWALRVFPCLQRLGIGERMVRAAERTLAQRGYREAEIGVEKGSPAANLYRRIGYRQVGERHEQYSYTTPAGEKMQIPVDQWIFRKQCADQD